MLYEVITASDFRITGLYGSFHLPHEPVQSWTNHLENLFGSKITFPSGIVVCFAYRFSQQTIQQPLSFAPGHGLLFRAVPDCLFLRHPRPEGTGLRMLHTAPDGINHTGNAGPDLSGQHKTSVRQKNINTRLFCSHIKTADIFFVRGNQPGF